MNEMPTPRRRFLKFLLATPLAYVKPLLAAPTAVERMTPSEKQIAQDAFDAFLNRGDASVLQRHGLDVSVPANDAFLRSVGRSTTVGNKGQAYRAAFPDLKLSFLSSSQQGNVVTLRWRADGAHRGAIGSLAATGRRASVLGTTEVTFVNGKIVKLVSSFDHNTLRGQLGAPRVG
jgi:predicted ester cyclase